MNFDEYEMFAAETMDGAWKMTLRHKKTGIEVKGEGSSRFVLKSALVTELENKVKLRGE